jgi:hypothetical protein
MTNLLTEAFKKAQNLPEDIQDELAKQLIEDRQFKNETHQPRGLTRKGSSGIV